MTMTIRPDLVFVDTNVLVYANLAGSPFCRQAIEHLQSLGSRGVDLWVSRQVLREHLSAMTKPCVLTQAIATASLLRDVRYFASRFRVAEDGPMVTEQLCLLMAQVQVHGRQVHDANIVATMQVHGVHHLLTHNVADFNRFTRFITVLPLAGAPWAAYHAQREAVALSQQE